MNKSKQIIVVRKDLNMPKGKIAAQVAHASMGVLLNLGKYDRCVSDDNELLSHDFTLKLAGYERGEFIVRQPLIDWLTGAFTKVCVSCDSEQELLELEAAAKNAGIIHCLITDSGLTVFDGVPTKTCLAIGPDYSDVLDPLTRHLKLL